MEEANLNETNVPEAEKWNVESPSKKAEGQDWQVDPETS